MFDFRTISWAAMLALAAPFAGEAQVRSVAEVVEVRLLEGWRQADGRHMSALEIRLAPGWKTYWRSPGDGGIPTTVTLDSGAVRLHWPSPDVFYTGMMRSIGYQEDVLLPMELQLEDGAQSVRGRVELGVCQDVCMPVSLEIEAVLPGSGRPDARIIAALSDRPLTAEEIGAPAASCRIRPISDGLRVEAHIPIMDIGGQEEVVFELPDPQIWISDPRTEARGGMLVATADIVPPDAGPFALDRSELRITVLGRRGAFEMLGCAAG